MVKLLIVSCFLLVVTWAAGQSEDSGTLYDSRYDYVDLDSILDNKRLIRNYVECLLNQKPCSPDGKALKRILPEGLRTKCARCTIRQKHNALHVLRRLRQDYPDEWSKLAVKWDPTGDFTKRFESILDNDNNNRIDTPIYVPTEVAASTAATAPSPSPSLFNRFGSDEDGEPQGLPSNGQPTVRQAPNTPLPPKVPTALPPTVSPVTLPTTQREDSAAFTSRPAKNTPRPKPKPANRPDYATPSNGNVDFRPIYAGTMGLIDHFGNKIIKTTELVTDLLKNTVRAVVG